MQKVYLLLRNNRQTGPFTIIELWESGLKPDDLIWVEGKSTSWIYPSEITELSPYYLAQIQAPDNDRPKPEGGVMDAEHQRYLPKESNAEIPKVSAPKKVFVRLPVNSKRPAADVKQLTLIDIDPLPDPIEAANGRRQTSDGGETADGKRKTADELEAANGRRQTADGGETANGKRQTADELEAANRRQQTADVSSVVARNGALEPDPIEKRAEELRNKILASANGRRQTADELETANGKRQTADERVVTGINGMQAPDPIEKRAEELRNKILAQASANGKRQTADVIPVTPTNTASEPDPIEKKAEELRNKILAQTSANGKRQTTDVNVTATNTASEPDPIEKRAEELRNKILAAANGKRQTADGGETANGRTQTADERGVAGTNDVKESEPIEMMRAEELRNKILAAGNGKRETAEVSSVAATNSAPEPDPIAMRAEELRNKILTAANGKRQTADYKGETTSSSPTVPDPIAAKAEELRKKILAQSGDYASTANGSRQPAELRKKTVAEDEKFPEPVKIKKQPAFTASLSGSLKDMAGAIKKKVSAFSLDIKKKGATHTSITGTIQDKAKQTGSIQANTLRKLKDAEAGFTTWVHNQKSPTRKDIIKKTPAIVGIALLLIAGGYITSRFGSESPVVASGNSRDQVPFDNQDSASLMEQTPILPVEASPEENISNTYPHPSEPVAVQSTKEKEEPVSKPAAETKVAALQISAEEKRPIVNTPPDIKAVEKKPVENRSPEKKAVVTALPGDREIKVEPVTPAKKEEPSVNTTQENRNIAEAPAKKKTFTEKIDGFFGKLNKRIADPEEATQVKEEQQKSATVENAERKAVRRGEEAATTPKIANLNEYIEVNTREASGDWMLGVHGLKLVVHNRSSETVHQAAVEVRYYNEHQELIEKKLINVSNVPPKKSVTVSAPDHRLADHAEVTLVSAR